MHYADTGSRIRVFGHVKGLCVQGIEGIVERSGLGAFGVGRGRPEDGPGFPESGSDWVSEFRGYEVFVASFGMRIHT